MAIHIRSGKRDRGPGSKNKAYQFHLVNITRVVALVDVYNASSTVILA